MSERSAERAGGQGRCVGAVLVLGDVGGLQMSW